jgi:hypothetical protein
MRITIGDVRSWQLGEGRAEARRLGVLVDRGEDPRIEASDRALLRLALLRVELDEIALVGDDACPSARS